jgi:hypothetical protein
VGLGRLFGSDHHVEEGREAGHELLGSLLEVAPRLLDALLKLQALSVSAFSRVEGSRTEPMGVGGVCASV